jgi:hypothetical protein
MAFMFGSLPSISPTITWHRGIEVTRSQMARILRFLPSEGFERTGIHAVRGQVTLRVLLEAIIPHHVQFVEENRQATSGQFKGVCEQPNSGLLSGCGMVRVRAKPFCEGAARGSGIDPNGAQKVSPKVSPGSRNEERDHALFCVTPLVFST